MLLTKIKFAVRFLLRAKSYIVINLVGLSLSLACCIVLLRYIHREFTVDSHANDINSIILPLRDIDGNVYPASNPEDENFSVEDKNMEDRCKISDEEESTVISDGVAYVTDIMAVDTRFFHFFDYKFLEGTPDLSRPDNVILTDRYAKRLFGSLSPIGRNIHFDSHLLTVVGVIELPVCKTTFNFDILVPIKLKESWEKLLPELIRVNSGFDIDRQNEKSNVYRVYNMNDGNMRFRYRYIPWKDFYFEKSVADKYESIFRFGNRDYVLVLCGVVALLFIVGVMNFVNLYSVVMQKRRKIYGVKKVFGLSQRGLFTELLIENFLLFACAIFLSWCIIEVSSGLWYGLFYDDIPTTSFDWVLSLGLLLSVPLFVSVFFYFCYGYRNPVGCMQMASSDDRRMFSRYLFLFLQYSITMFLMIMSVYFQRHFDFLIETPHGYDTERIMIANLYRHNRIFGNNSTTVQQLAERSQKVQALQKKLDESPLVEYRMDSYTTVWGGSPVTLINSSDENFDMEANFVTKDFFNFWNLDILEGKLPDPDNCDRYVLALNQSAMKLLGYAELDGAMVRSNSALVAYMIDGKLVNYGIDAVPVVAVVQDYYQGHLTEGIKPMVYVINSSRVSGDFTLIKVKKDKEKEFVDYLNDVEKEVYNTEDFTYKWADDVRKEMYKEDKKIALIYTVFSYIAIAVSCLGLLGISLFDIRRRYRELAIRKINGAKPIDFYKLLGKSYLANLLLAYVVALPSSWLVINYYTASFVIKAPITFGLFLLPLVIVLVLSAVTLFYQINKATHINPSEVIKIE